MQDRKSVVFGPVPSRRLGLSLGINNIQPKTCSYSCVYCQLGKTGENIVERQAFFRPCDILKEVLMKVESVALRNGRIDYLTFVSAGEPTLDINIGEEMLTLKQVRIPIALLTNASLLWSKDVRQDLLKADYVSLKVDAVTDSLWRQIDRPQKTLKIDSVLEGIRNFAEQFSGTIVTETMLISGVDYVNEIERIAVFLAGLKKLNRAYIAVPTRPPTEHWVKPAKEETVNTAFQIFSEKLGIKRVECLTGYEGNTFASTESVVKDLLSIMSVHPMREDAVAEFIRKANSDWRIVEELLCDGQLVKLEFEGKGYYLRKWPSRNI